MCKRYTKEETKEKAKSATNCLILRELKAVLQEERQKKGISKPLFENYTALKEKTQRKKLFQVKSEETEGRV